MGLVLAALVTTLVWQAWAQSLRGLQRARQVARADQSLAALHLWFEQDVASTTCLPPLREGRERAGEPGEAGGGLVGSEERLQILTGGLDKPPQEVTYTLTAGGVRRSARPIVPGAAAAAGSSLLPALFPVGGQAAFRYFDPARGRWVPAWEAGAGCQLPAAVRLELTVPGAPGESGRVVVAAPVHAGRRYPRAPE